MITMCAANPKASQTDDNKPHCAVVRKLASAIVLSADYLLDDNSIHDKHPDKIRAFIETDEIDQEEKRDFFRRVNGVVHGEQERKKAFFVRD